MTFFDETSKTVYNQLAKSDSPVHSRVMLNIERFEIGSRYVTAKVQNRYGENVTINIQGGVIDSIYKMLFPLAYESLTTKTCIRMLPYCQFNPFMFLNIANP